MPPSDLIRPSSRNEPIRRFEVAGGNMFTGAEQTTITGGEFNAVRTDSVTINHNYNVHAIVSEENFTRLLDRGVASTLPAISLSRIESGTEVPNNVINSEHEVSPGQILPWPENMNLLAPGFHERAGAIFYDTLLLSQRGFPIWKPVPSRNLPISYRRKGVTIGDLGLITELGTFEFLFNVTRPIDHPDHPPDLPQDLYPPPFPLNSGRIHVVPSSTPFYPFTSKGVSSTHREDGSGVLFKCSSSSTSRGGIITLPLGFNSYEMGNIKSFRRHFLQNAVRWYAYAINQIGTRARNGNLCLVVGHESTTVCGLAAFELPEPGDIDFYFCKGPEVAGIQTYGWRHMHGTSSYEHKMHHEAPEILELRGNEASEQERMYENLCFFVRSMTARVSEDVWAQLQRESDSQSESHVSEGGGGASNVANKSSHAGSESTKPQAPNSPSNTINEYLLKTERTAKIAVTADDQWIGVLQEDDSQFPHSEELMKRILDKYTIELEDSVVFLEPKTLESDSVPEDLLLNTAASEQKASLAGAGTADSKQFPRYHSPNVSRRVDPPIISTASPKGGHHLGNLVDSPESDTGTLDSEDSECLTPCSSESAGLFQSSRVGGKVDSLFSVGIPGYRADTGDATREPPLPRTDRDLTHQGRR